MASATANLNYPSSRAHRSGNWCVVQHIGIPFCYLLLLLSRYFKRLFYTIPLLLLLLFFLRSNDLMT